MVGWIVGATGATISVVVGDPGFLGALAVFVVSSIVGCLAAALMVATRPERDEASVAATAARSAPAVAHGQPALQGIAASIPAPVLVEAGGQRPS
jgi:hypothetical protein